MKRSDAARYITTLCCVLAAWMWVSVAGGADSKSAAKAAAIKPPEQKATEMKPAPVYKYNPIGKPDPFKPFVEKEVIATKKKAQVISTALSPLQREGIEQYKLVGIAGDERGRKAIVQDVKGKVYPIFVGTYIGLKNGRVVGILSDRVIVEETVKAPAGKAKANRIVIKLRQEEG